MERSPKFVRCPVVHCVCMHVHINHVFAFEDLINVNDLIMNFLIILLNMNNHYCFFVLIIFMIITLSTCS